MNPKLSVDEISFKFYKAAACIAVFHVGSVKERGALGVAHCTEDLHSAVCSTLRSQSALHRCERRFGLHNAGGRKASAYLPDLGPARPHKPLPQVRGATETLVGVCGSITSAQQRYVNTAAPTNGSSHPAHQKILCSAILVQFINLLPFSSAGAPTPLPTPPQPLVFFSAPKPP